MEIIEAVSEDQINQVRQLMRAFVSWHKDRHSDELALIDRYFDENTFAAELASLPGQYAPPPGRLFLALEEGQPAGCAALRALDAKTCEMKRMFVYPQFHGKGIGRALAERLIHEARQIGYSCMRLDTGPKQFEAQTLYHSLGFKEIEPYYTVPEELRHWLLFMELSL
jgi:N-acetylglutamate synthase and related acetyltransferases